MLETLMWVAVLGLLAYVAVTMYDMRKRRKAILAAEEKRRAERVARRQAEIVSRFVPTTPVVDTVRRPLKRYPVATFVIPVVRSQDNTGDMLLAGVIGYEIGQAMHSSPPAAEPSYSGGGGDYGGGGASSSWDSSGSSSPDSGSSCSGGSD